METNIISELTTFIETCTDSISCGCRIKRDPEAGRIRRIKRVRKVEGQTWEKILCNKK